MTAIPLWTQEGEAMVISLGETIAILKKWKDESAQIFVEVESPFQQTVPAPQGTDVRWTMHQHVHVSRLTPPPEGERSTKTIVQFEGSSGTLSLSIGECRFAYDEPRAAGRDDREEAEALTVSALSVLFPSEACFHFYELRDA